MPIDLAYYERDRLKLAARYRFAPGDPYFTELSRQWSEGVRRVFRQLPDVAMEGPGTRAARPEPAEQCRLAHVEIEARPIRTCPEAWCTFDSDTTSRFSCPQPTPMLLTLHAHYTRSSHLVRRDDMLTDPAVPLTLYRDGFGNWVTRLVAPTGSFRVTTDALIWDSGALDSTCAERRATPR